jgi:hypothetical protein
MQPTLDNLTALAGELSPWERGFVESVVQQYKQHGRLSDNQTNTINKIAACHDPAAVKARNTWRALYDDEKRKLALFAAEYYLNNPPYFGDVARRILGEDKYIPSEKCFRKMTENKYVKRAQANLTLEPVFSVGQLVRFRRNAEVREWHRQYNHVAGRKIDLRGKLAVVLSFDDVPGHAKGSREYEVLPAGDSKPVTTLERRLMRCKSL